MPLSDDQRAMLQLLLERGQTYEDIGSLLGLDVDEVRRRARSALTEIGGEDPDREVALTDYLLGQADPIGRADAARHLQADAGARDLAQKLLVQLRLLAPSAELPTLPAAKVRGAPQAAKPPPAAAAEPATPQPARPGLTSRQKGLIAALLGGGVLVVLIVLLATGAFSGDGDDGNGEPAANGSSPTTTASGQEENLTRAILTSVDGGDARGVALFGRVRNVPALEVRAVDLDPSPQGSSYSVWLYRSDPVSLRVGGVRVGDSGRMLAQIPVPTQALGFVANGTFDEIVVSLGSDADVRAEVRRARENQGIPRFVGEKVLRGEIEGPAVEQAQGGGAQGGAGGAGSGQGQLGGSGDQGG